MILTKLSAVLPCLLPPASGYNLTTFGLTTAISDWLSLLVTLGIGRYNWLWSIRTWSNWTLPLLHFQAIVMPDFRRKQHATRRGGGNEDVSVSVRVSSALRLASDSRRGQNTVFCLLPTKLATKDGQRATLLASRYLNACDSVKCFPL